MGWQGKDDGSARNGSTYDCRQLGERVERKQPRHKMGQRMDLFVKWEEMSLRTRETGERVGQFVDFINPSNFAGGDSRRELLTRKIAGGRSLRSRPRRTRRRQSSLRIA